MAIQNVGGYNTNIIAEELFEPGDGITIDQNKFDLAVPQSPFQYYTANSINPSYGSSLVTLPLIDGSTVQAISMDYAPGSKVAIETVALNQMIPRVTLFWLATATSSKDTVFAMNTGLATTNVNWWTPSARVNTAYLRDDRYLYIGGDFTSLKNTVNQHRFGVIDLSAGLTPNVLYGSTARPLTAVTPGFGTSVSAINFVGGSYVDKQAFFTVSTGVLSGIRCNLQFDASVNVIKQFGEYLFFGGTFTKVTLNSYYDASPVGQVVVPLTCGRLFAISLTAVSGASRYIPRMVTFDLNNEVLAIEPVTDNGLNCLFISGKFTNNRIITTGYSAGGVRTAPAGGTVTYSYLPDNNTTTQINARASTSPACKSLIKIDFLPEQTAVGDKFKIDYVFNDNVAGVLAAAANVIRTLKYLDGVIYAGGNNYPTSYLVDGEKITAHRAKDGNLSNSRGKLYNYGNNEFVNKWYPWKFASDVYTIEYDPIQKSLYVGGNFTKVTDIPKNTVYTRSYIAAFNMDTEPVTIYKSWDPAASGYVSNIQVDDTAVYVIGNFTKMGTVTRSRCAAISKANAVSEDVVLDWRADLGGGAADVKDKIMLIPDSSKLSGALITGGYTTINGISRSHISKVIKFGQEIKPYVPKTVIWEMYGKTITNQTDINVDITEMTSVTSNAYQQYILNTTSFPITASTLETFAGMQKGLPVRIIIKRKENYGSYQPVHANDAARVWLLGARIDYDTKAEYDQYIESITRPVGITTQLKNLSAVASSSVTLSVFVSGSPPFDYNWYFNDALIADVQSNVYTVDPVTVNEEGNYYVEILNVRNSVQSETVGLYVTPLQYTTVPTATSVFYGETVVLSAYSSGLNVQYQWYYNNTLVPFATSTAFTITSAVESDDGQYKVIASNFLGSISSTNVLLTVVTLSVVQQPLADVTVPVGGTTSLSVAVSGRAPFSVQWLSGSTSGSIDTAIASPNNLGIGYYKARITNGAGTTLDSNPSWVHN